MSEEDNQIFQERVDELLFIEQRMEKRLKSFVKMMKEAIAKRDKTLESFSEKINQVEQVGNDISLASNSIQSYMRVCETHDKRSWKILLGSIAFSLLVLGGSLIWSRHIFSNFEEAKVSLSTLESKLEKTPVVEKFEGKYYVRIIPKTGTRLTNNGKDIGTYFRIWTKC